MPQKEKEIKTMTAILVPPEPPAKSIKMPQPAERSPRPKMRRQDTVRTGETGAPKKIFAVPKGRKSERGRVAGRESARKPAATRQYKTDQSKSARPAEKLVREKLFDSAVIGKIARAGSRRAKSIKSGGVSFDIGQERYYGWVQRLSEKLASVWKYPQDLAERRIFGDVYVRMSFKKDGSLSRAELVRTSGYRSLDDSAMRALKDANPYWPLPQDWNEDELTLIGHFYVP